jgi:hypothetical protein
LIVFILAVFFGVIFLCIKNSIDRLPGHKVYVAAVALYALSWGLRGFLGENHAPITMLWLLALITLCTSHLSWWRRTLSVATMKGGMVKGILRG